MKDTGVVPSPVTSLDELLAVAHAIEQEAAARYRALSADMKRQGDVAMAACFETLAAAEDRHATEVAGPGWALLGHAPDPARIHWEIPADLNQAVSQGA